MAVRRRIAILEAENGQISEGHMPEAYEVCYEPADELISIGAVGGEAIEFTRESWQRVAEEARLLASGGDQ